MSKAKKDTKRHNAPWTPAELKRLRALARARMSAREAAAKLGRSTGALKFKAMVERIRFHAIEQPRGVQKRRVAEAARAARARSRAARKAAIARRVKPAGAVHLIAAAAGS